MKKILLLASGLLFFGATYLQAQNWVNGGNALGANGTIGTNSNHSFLFETYNTERGRITNTGLWGIGTGAIALSAKFTINSATGQDPLQIKVNGNNKLIVHRYGGMSVGSGSTPPPNGLYVAGSIGVGTTTPNSKLHINTVVNQDPLRVMYNGSTKLFVHRGGGVAIGGAVIPPANGLYVAGNAAIGTNMPSAQTILTVQNDEPGTTGIIARGNGFGLRAYGTNDDGLGSGIYAAGGATGVSAYGEYHGVFGTADFEAGVYGNGGYGGAHGVQGFSESGYGGYFQSDENGLYASTNNPDIYYAGYFEGDIFSTGSYLGSDKNIKKNIQAMGNAMSILNKLKPSYYQFRDDGKYASLKLPAGNHYGLLAQDVEEVLPNLVKETTHEVREQSMLKPGLDGKVDFSAIKQASKEPREKITIKAVNYTELIPILIKGAQEQQATIEQQNAKIDQQQAAIEQQNAKIAELTQLLNKLANTTGLLKPNESYLSQSTPNPNTYNTRITYNLPAGTDKAKLVITDSAGRQIKSIQLNNNGLIEVDTTTFSAGTYFYSLYIDEVMLDTKKMTVYR